MPYSTQNSPADLLNSRTIKITKQNIIIGALIVSLIMSSDVALAGGTSVQASLGVTVGTNTTTQTAAITNANVNLGMNVPTTVATGVVAAATWVSGVTLGVNTAGVVRFRVIYQETSPA